MEATKQTIEIDPGTYLKTIKVGQFLETKIFAIYAILFHKIFGIHIKHPVEIDMLQTLSEENIDLSSHITKGYIENFSKIVEDLELLSSYLMSLSPNQDATKPLKLPKLSPDEVQMLGDIIQRSYSLNFSHLSKSQKGLMKWIDLVIEYTRFGLRRDER